MNFLQPIGRMFITFLAAAGRLATLAADGNLHLSEKVYTPRADPLVPVAEQALLKGETS